MGNIETSSCVYYDSFNWGYINIVILTSIWAEVCTEDCSEKYIEFLYNIVGIYTVCFRK